MCLHKCRKGHELIPVLKEYRYAHRGLHCLAEGIAENTVPAFARAAEHGFGAELDVHLTRDGRLAVIHDSDLTRLCGQAKIAEELTMDELRALSILGTRYTVPEFCEVLPLFKGKTPLIVEVKTRGANAAPLTEMTCKALDGAGVTACIESFDPRVLMWLRKNRPEFCRGQLTCSFKTESEPKSRVLRPILSQLMLNFLTEPDFIGVRFTDRHTPGVLISRYIYGAAEAAWTLTTQETLEKAEKAGCIPVFEGFIPG